MAAYTRQSTITDGDTITAALFNNEYNQLLTAFSYASSGTTGHKHDGTAGEGGHVPQIGDQDFLNKIVTDSTNNRFGIFVQVSSSAVEQIRIQDGAIVPVTDNDIDLGTSSVEFKDAYFDGTVTTDALVADTADINGGTVDGATIGASSATTIVGTTITANTAFVPDASDGAALGTSSLEFSDLFLADGAVINFGDDQDVTLTHVADTGLLLNSTMQLQFNDSSQYINAPSATVLDINATDEIELNATLVDINANVEVSGTLTVAGAVDFGDAALSNVGAVQLDSVAGDGDTDTSITFSGSDVITIATGGTTAMTLDASQNVSIAGDLTITGDDLTMGTNTSGMLLIADGTNFNPTAVTSLSEISTVANDDVFLAIDTSGGGLKKIERSAIVSGLASSSAISNVVEDTTPQLGGDLDTNSQNILIDDAHFIGDENGNEQIIFQTTSSAVNQIDVTNAATGNAPEIAATGGDTNVSLKLTPKGSGQVLIDGNVGIETGLIDLKNGGSQSAVRLYCESSNAHYAAIQAPAHADFGGNVTLTLPASTDTLAGIAATQTLTNKTLTTPVIAEIDSGSTITLDATTDIVLDADGGDIFFKDDGTTFGSATNTSGNLIIKSGTTTALTFSGANVTGAGTYTGGGTMTTGGNIVIPDAGNIGSASDTDAIAIASDGVVTFSQVPVLPDDTVATADIQDNAVTLAKMAGIARGKIIVGDASGDPSVLSAGSNGTFLKSDGTDLSFAAPSVALDDVATGDAAVTLATSAGNITIDAQGNDTDIILKGTDGSSDKTAISIDMSENALVKFPNDSQALSFGADGDVTLTHIADQGLILKNTNTSDDKPGTLYLQTGETDIAANDYLGRIFFQAPDEATGTDAIAISAEISAISEGDFAADNNATSLSFGTGSSGASSQKMKLSSTGVLTLNGASGSIIIPDGGTIGSASDTDAIAIASTGETSFTQNVGIGVADPVSFLHLEKSDATAYDATDSDGQVSVGPTIYLENPANANDTVGGQIVFGMRSTEAQARIGATGGANPSLVFGTADAQRMEINSAGEVGIGTTPNTSVTLNVYNNETGHNVINVKQDNSSSASAVVNISNDGTGYGFYNVNANGSGTYTQSSRGTAGYYRQTGSVASNYAIYAQGDTNYGIYGRTLHSSYGAVIGYDHDTAGYGILGYQSTYAFYGAGNGYFSGTVTEASDERLKDVSGRMTKSDGVLDKLKQLSPVFYKWKENTEQYNAGGKDSQPENIGFLAQEVELLFPHLISNNPTAHLPNPDDPEDSSKDHNAGTINKTLGSTKSIAYGKLVSYLTVAIQELSDKNDALEARIKTLEDA